MVDLSSRLSSCPPLASRCISPRSSNVMCTGNNTPCPWGRSHIFRLFRYASEATAIIQYQYFVTVEESVSVLASPFASTYRRAAVVTPAMFRLTKCDGARLQRIGILRWRAFVQFERDCYRWLVFGSFMHEFEQAFSCPVYGPVANRALSGIGVFYAVMTTVTRPGHDHCHSSADRRRVDNCYRNFRRAQTAVIYLRKVPR